MTSFKDRIIRAAKLDVHLYEEVEADKGALRQAMGVVILSSIAAGVGTVGTRGLGGLLFGTISALILWYLWAYIIYIIGTKLLPEPRTKADYGELLRTIGFFQLPGVDSGIRYRPRTGKCRFSSRLNLDACSNGDRRQTSPGLYEHITRCRGLRDRLDRSNVNLPIIVFYFGWLGKTSLMLFRVVIKTADNGEGGASKHPARSRGGLHAHRSPLDASD